jgi:hypothetical protein
MTPRASDLRFTAAAAIAFVALAGGVTRLQVPLAAELHALKDTDDIYPFPPPALLRIATLGYVSATTDVLWGKLLVENGIHWHDRRAFPDLEPYLDAINGLEPTFRSFYEFVDSLLCYRPMNGHELEARETRAYLERGTQVLKDDPEVWKHYGQFLAFMGPSYLTDEGEKKRWKHDGSIALQHAVELGAGLHLGIAASAVLADRLDEREAAVRFLERAYALADDDATRADIIARLQIQHAGAEAECAQRMGEIVQSGWRERYRFLKPTMYMLMAPTPDAMRCVGPDSAREPGCERDWEALRPACR